MPAPRVAIIGAGLAGLVCARILQIHGIPAEVFEADSDADARQQGGSLDIHHDTGQVALRAGGLFEEFLRHTHQGGEAMRILDKTGRVHLDEQDGGEGGRPEVDRTVLRRLLLDSLEPGSLHWGAKVRRAVSTATGPVVEFDGGRTLAVDLVVGADGAWSKTRAALSDVTPVYTGITIVELHLDQATTRHPEAAAIVGTGNLFALSDDKSIGGHGGDHLWLGVGLRVPEDWRTSSGIQWHDSTLVRQALLGEFADWTPGLTNLIRDSDETIVARPIYALPIGFRWNPVPGITLVGDAAHVMSPFAGEGANLALIDGADLAAALLDRLDVDEAVTSYEASMFERAAEAAQKSAFGLDLMFNPQSPQPMVDFFAAMA